MVDVIHEHTTGNADSTGGMGMILGILLIIIFVWALFVYGFPMMRGSGGTTNNTTTPQINVPDTVDVNLNQGGQ